MNSRSASSLNASSGICSRKTTTTRRTYKNVRIELDNGPAVDITNTEWYKGISALPLKAAMPVLPTTRLLLGLQKAVKIESNRMIIKTCYASRKSNKKYKGKK